MNRLLKAKIIERYGSQWRFAQALGVHESAVSKIMRGYRPLDDATKQEWARKLNCDPAIFENR